MFFRQLCGVLVSSIEEVEWVFYMGHLVILCASSILVTWLWSIYCRQLSLNEASFLDGDDTYHHKTGKIFDYCTDHIVPQALHTHIKRMIFLVREKHHLLWELVLKKVKLKNVRNRSNCYR